MDGRILYGSKYGRPLEDGHILSMVSVIYPIR